MTNSRTTSKIRCGRPLAGSRRRQYVSVVGWKEPASMATPHAAFHRRSNVTASAVSRSESPCRVCNTSTAATTSGGIDGRPPPEGNKSSNTAGNNRCRYSASNANRLPGGSRCPATDSTAADPADPQTAPASPKNSSRGSRTHAARPNCSAVSQNRRQIRSTYLRCLRNSGGSVESYSAGRGAGGTKGFYCPK
jgi:hypothetical protein